ncbi:hypothetical protein V8F20_008565 [Naviculisporaceae sp. PSN 640]
MGQATEVKPLTKAGTDGELVLEKNDIPPTSNTVLAASTLSGQTSPVQRLPHELLNMICHFLTERTDNEQLLPTYSKAVRTALEINRSSLMRFGATCRLVHATVQTLVFKDIIFFNPRRLAYLRLLRTLEARPQWKSVVSSVECAWFPSLTPNIIRAGPRLLAESADDKMTEAQALKVKLGPWFHKRLSESFFCDSSKPQWSRDRDALTTRVPEVYQDNALCMMLLSQLPNLRRARVSLPMLDGPNWRRHFDSRNLKWPAHNPRLTSLKELQLCPDGHGTNFSIFSATSILHGAPNLETLVLVKGVEPIVSVGGLKLHKLRSLIIKACGLYHKHHLLNLLVRPCPQLRHFQIDFFDHKQTFNFGTNYTHDIWERCFTPFEVDWDDTPAAASYPPRPSQITSTQQVTLRRYCTTAANLLDALSPVSSSLETLYLGQLSKTLDAMRSRRRQRIKFKRGGKPLTTFMAFPKLKHLCIDVRMIHQIHNPTETNVLVDLIKDCPDLEALMLYGTDHVNLANTGSFACFARAVDGKETFPSLRKVVILADDYYGRNLGKTTRNLGSLAGVWSRENQNKEVKLEFLMDDSLSR